MHSRLRSEQYGEIPFGEGNALSLSPYLLPQVPMLIANGPWGQIAIQELKTHTYVLRHFLFQLPKRMAFFSQEESEGIQTILAVHGSLEISLPGQPPVGLNEKEYTLIHAGAEETTANVPGEKLCSILNVYYQRPAYQNLLHLFPAFKLFIRQNVRKTLTFIHPPRLARYSVHDSIAAIWQEHYSGVLEQKHIELHLKTTLFTLLAQTYTAPAAAPLTPQEREKALAAREIILRNIRVHVPTKDIAAELNCSIGLLKRAFSKMYGTGLLQFLRKTRMESARTMLLQGQSLKAVALEVGMRPRNFPKEFKSYFGYTVTQLKKGLSQ